MVILKHSYLSCRAKESLRKTEGEFDLSNPTFNRVRQKGIILPSTKVIVSSTPRKRVHRNYRTLS